MPGKHLTDFETFYWGAAGSFLAFLAIFVTPRFPEMVKRDSLTLSFSRITIYLFIMLTMVGSGALFAVVMGDATLPKHAAVYGATWEAGLKALSNVATKFTEDE